MQEVADLLDIILSLLQGLLCGEDVGQWELPLDLFLDGGGVGIARLRHREIDRPIVHWLASRALHGSVAIERHQYLRPAIKAFVYNHPGDRHLQSAPVVGRYRHLLARADPQRGRQILRDDHLVA